ncbi:hypothetical protein [Nonomuraea fuscirosea]|uniref:hypothetical protein n=1 Tax=Nonomuraea fuscirosea TaxID=1291556 RepID=UPI0033FF529E
MDAAEMADVSEAAATPVAGAVVELESVHARVLDQDLQVLLGKLRYVAFTWDDAAHLYRAATRYRQAGRLAPDVSVRVAEAMAEAFTVEPSLRPDANALPPGQTDVDHGSGSTAVDPTASRLAGRSHVPESE